VSIWQTRLSIDDDDHDTECGVYELDPKGKASDLIASDGRRFRRLKEAACTCNRRPPIAYLGSHARVQPDAWRYGELSTAQIPPWCAWDAGPHVDDDGPPEPYLRISSTAYNYRDPRREEQADVVLDARQVEALRDDLTDWLGRIRTPTERSGTIRNDREQPATIDADLERLSE
jgi:hypothetical protein